MKIAIVGAGIVGSTAAYYLSKEKDVEVTVFDAEIKLGIAWLVWELIFTKS